MTLRKMMPFFVVAIVFNLAASFAHPVTPTLFQNLGLGDYMFGYAMASTLTASFLFSPLWGKLGSILSSRVCLCVGCLGYAVGQFIFMNAQTEGMVLVARFIAGAFSAAVYVSVLGYTVNMAPDTKTRGVWLTLVATIQSVAGAFGFFIGGVFGAVRDKNAFVAQIVTLVACGVLFVLLCKKDALQERGEISVGQMVRDANPFQAFLDSRKFMTVTFALLFVMCALQNLGQIAFDQTFNYYIKDQFGFPPTYNGALKAAMGFITLIANSTIAIYLIRNTDKRKPLIGLFSLCCVTMFVILNMKSIVPYLVINVFFYAFSAVSLPLMQDITAEIGTGEDSRLVMGFYNAMKSLGGILGAAASGTLYVFSPQYPFVCIMVAFGVAAVVAVVFAKRSKADALKVASTGL